MRKQLLALAGMVCLLFLFFQTSPALGDAENRDLPQTTDSIKSALEAVYRRLPHVLESWKVHLPQQPKDLQSLEVAQNVYQAMKSQFTVTPMNLRSRKIDIASVLSGKYGNPHQMALLYAAFLETLKLRTAIVPDEQTWLVLFSAGEDKPTPNPSTHPQPPPGEGRKEGKNTITWKERRWGVIAIKEKWSAFAEAQQDGIERFLAKRRENRFEVIDVHALWKPPGEPAIDGFIKRGISKGQQGHLESARELFNSVLERDKTNAAAYNNLGNLDLFSKKLASAILNYLKALQYDEQDARIYLNLGIAHILQAQATRGDEYNETTKKDWINQSERAFDAAYRSIGSYEDMCYFLAIQPMGKPEYDSYRQLLLDAESRTANKVRHVLGGRGLETINIPVYWKDTVLSTKE